MDLTPRQHQALQQLRDLTNGADDDVAASVLRSVDWDVQRAAELIFGSGAPPPPPPQAPPPARPPAFEPLEMDDTQQGQGPRRPQPSTTTSLLSLARPLLTLLSFPLHLLAALARLLLVGVLRLPLPSVPFPALRFAGLSFYRARWTGGAGGGAGGGGGGAGGRGGGGSAAERWVRALEEETGALARGGAVGASTSLAGAAGGSGAGLVSRGYGNGGGGGSGDDARRVLPAFALCTYEEFLRTLARDARVGCVVLVSAEHDAVAAFKRTTLVDPAFVRLLDEHEILVWGGDVREHDAWSAAEKLQATTYPFLAFLSLQPTRAPSSSHTPSSTSAPPTLTVLSRHAGPPYPASAPTSAHTLIQHLEDQLLPRVTPYLGRLAAAARERTRDRELRAEQDAAFASAAARDKARIEAALAAERAAAAAAAAAALAAERAKETAREEAEEEARNVEERLAWRRWTRRAVVSALPANPEKALRVALRLPSGARVVHSFAGSASLTTLYAVVDAALLPAALSPEDDPSTPPSAQQKQQAQQRSGPEADAESLLEQHVGDVGGAGGSAYWGFRVASAYPRAELRWAAGAALAEVAQLRGGGQVVVELLDAGNGRRAAPRAGAEAAEEEADDEDDGYDTEESE